MVYEGQPSDSLSIGRGRELRLVPGDYIVLLAGTHDCLNRQAAFPSRLRVTPMHVKRRWALGPRVGGNLSLLMVAPGTSCAIDVEGAMLFVEEVHEPAYRIGRMMTHLGHEPCRDMGGDFGPGPGSIR
ncbi:MAG: hypothetical protein ACOCVQ_01560 [Bacillota bacterium]